MLIRKFVVSVTAADSQFLVGSHKAAAAFGYKFGGTARKSGKAVDVGPDSITIEASGGDDKLHALVSMLEPYGIIELVKSGQVALGRGNRSINEKNRAVLRAAQ